MLRAARVETKSLPVLGSTSGRSASWTCASLWDMAAVQAKIRVFPRSYMPRKLFVTTALPYANGSFHIGHIMEYIQADIWVRFQRMQGHEVHFVGADDAHGAPIMLKAEAEGVTPEQLVQRIARERPKYLRSEA